MPAAIVAVAASAAGAAVTSIVGGGIVGSLLGAVAASVVGGVLTRAITPNTSAQQIAQSLSLNADSQTAPLYTVYGETRIGGTAFIIGASGGNNEYVHIIIAHCEGEADSASVLYLDDIESTEGKFSGLVNWEFFRGTDNQSACQSLIDANIGWTANDRLCGVCYSYVRLKYKSDVFNGIPQITVKLKGRKVYDPRSGITAWSNNPVLCLRDYLTNSRYGRGIPSTLLDNASFISAANACDANYTDTSGQQRKLHTCNGITNPDSSTLDNARAIISSFRGSLVYSARGYSVIVDKARAITFAFNEDNITGSWQIMPAGKRTLKNKIVGSWINPANQFKADLYPTESTEFRVQDNGVTLESQIELPFTTNQFEAQILCERELRQSRFGMKVVFNAFMSGLTCEVGDVVSITHSTTGWIAKPFLITKINLLNTDEVSIEAQEYDNAVYAANPLTAPRTTYTTLLPSPRVVPAFTGMALTSGTNVLQKMPDGTIISRIKVAWPQSTQIYLDNGQVEIQYKPTSATGWNSILSHQSTGTAYISPVMDSIAYDVRARWVNEFNIRGDWQSLQHLVVGKTAPPENVVSFAITLENERLVLNWAAVSDVDIAEYEIRNGASWESSTLVGKSRTTSLIVPANYSGNRTYWIKARDTSGNYSAIAASANLTINIPTAVNVTAEIIDNNVLLRWTAANSTLPIRTYNILRGDSYTGATVIGTKDGLFTTIFESISGTYKYWVVPVDIAGNIGIPSFVSATVSEPPDYLLKDKQISVLSGAKTNALLDNGNLYAPVNTAQTWQQHFSSNGWSSTSAQASAGYPIYIQPTPPSASYIEIIDYGAILPNFKLSVAYDSEQLAGICNIDCKLYTSVDGSTWSTSFNGFIAYLSNFRYVKIELYISSNDAGKSLVRLFNLRTQLDAKRKTWGGKIICNAGDAGGTIAYLTDDGTATGKKLFIDVISLTPGAIGTAQNTAIFDFLDAPNPLNFSAYLYNSAGQRISGTVYYTAIGV